MVMGSGVAPYPIYWNGTTSALPHRPGTDFTHWCDEAVDCGDIAQHIHSYKHLIFNYNQYLFKVKNNIRFMVLSGRKADRQNHHLE